MEAIGVVWYALILKKLPVWETLDELHILIAEQWSNWYRSNTCTTWHVAVMRCAVSVLFFSQYKRDERLSWRDNMQR